MDTLSIIITILSSIATIVLIVLGIVLLFVKNEKARQNINKVIEITKTVDKYVKDAEKLTLKKGSEKKELVTKLINDAAKQLGVKVDGEQISTMIENAVVRLKGDK